MIRIKIFLCRYTGAPVHPLQTKEKGILGKYVALSNKAFGTRIVFIDKMPTLFVVMLKCFLATYFLSLWGIKTHQHYIEVESLWQHHNFWPPQLITQHAGISPKSSFSISISKVFFLMHSIFCFMIKSAYLY